jgi:UDP-glucose 4-epimerase
MTPAAAGQVYNLGSGTGTPFLEMAHAVAEAVPGTEVQQIEWPADRYFVETGDYLGDITKITGISGWRPRTSVREGIARTVGFYRQHREHYW